nr:ABC transporter permease [uncultured Bacteroides sp.]
MNKQTFKQALMLLKQNRFFSIISIGCTAVTITFVMVVYMVYDLRTTDMVPEMFRSRMIYSGQGYSYRTMDHSNASGGMSEQTAHVLFDSLPGVDLVTYYTSLVKYPCSALSDGADKRRTVRFADATWFKVMQYNFISGRAFDKEEFDAQRKVAVISEQTARELFHTKDAVGRDVQVNFLSYRVVGVVANVSSLFTKAYSEIWLPLSVSLNKVYDDGSNGLRGNYLAILVRDKKTSETEVAKAVDKRVNLLNANQPDFTFNLDGYREHTQETFFQDKAISAPLVFALLIAILLIIPAINISGLMQSQIRHRTAEIGVRKAYGASKWVILNQLLVENLVLTLIGSLFGLLFSYVALFFSQLWLLGGAGIAHGSLGLTGRILFRPSIFIVVLLMCLLFNMLSVFVPAWLASRKGITEAIKGE